ncbi:MAG TPA: DEAD/DEAH box helicase [Euzebyales bacterium]|nr:DEAD/DEAH box helicase [Euzebyales bacterium]
MPVDGVARRQDHPVAAAALSDALPRLLSADRSASPSVDVYVRAARLAVGLVAEHQVAPVLRAFGDHVVATWQALLPVGGMAIDAVGALSDALPAAGHALPCGSDDEVWHPFALLRCFVDAVVDALVRSSSDDPRGARPRDRLLPWTARWQEAGTDAGDPVVPLRAERGELLAGVREWLRPYEQPRTEHTPELTLAPPDRADGPWTIEFGLRDRHGALLTAADLWRDDQGLSDGIEALLEALARAARVCGPIEDALDQRQPVSARLDSTEAWRFIDETAPLLGDAGYRVVLPDAVKQLRPRLQLGDTDDEGSLDGTVEVHWMGSIGDDVVDATTVDDLLEADEPLVWWRDRWVHVEPEVRAAWETRAELGTRVPLIEAVGLAVAGVGAVPGAARGSDVTRVTALGPLATMVDRLRGGGPAGRGTPVAPGFTGRLRGYQLDAVGWLEMMRGLGLGAVLADDMGLGKTVMLIAHVLAQTHGPHLVVCPTSVVTNWERELARFAPDLPVHRHHGPDRAGSLNDVEGVVVTSYGTLRRDIDVLSAVNWEITALDEAQQVKNPDTLGARAIRRLRSAHCVALTGTPVENRLRELWSVIDLTNPGLLGSRPSFERRFAHPIERRGDHTTRAQLRRLIAPFVLRRTKSDPSVAPDLPPRIERTVPCTMSDGQRRRYADAVDAFRRQAPGAVGGMQYRGAVLALLTRLKQICDHPALGATASSPTVGRSGKLAVAHQLIAEATQAGERVLVFTQFVGMARILVDELSHALGAPVPMLHGGMSATARQRVVDRFQGETNDPPPPVLVASLRAGGTGMNLTAATQVIHYDRWWNPAVEDQASDRAHRIGQTERVLIHRLMAVGTLEERIDAMLTAKREMASAVVGAGETWITELEPDALLELVELSDSSRGGDAPALAAVDAARTTSGGRS